MATTTTTTRGACPVCGTARPIRPDGTVRAHQDPTGYRRCAGSGWGPAPVRPGR